MTSKFAQIHFLTSYPASLLNRDDVGFAKRIPFGGAVRTRVSSQCLKRHWRTFEGEHSLSEVDVAESIRSRRTFEQHVYQPLVDAGETPERASAVTESIMATVLGDSAKAKKARESEEAKSGALRTGQITVLGRPEVDFFRSEAKAILSEVEDTKKIAQSVKKRFSKEAKKNLQSLRHASGLSAALFGRMVTSDLLARGDAAVHVAHAFTVHEEASESDYFSAVDDLTSGDEDRELGSGHIGSTELTSGLFYGYVAVDIPLLVSNLEGCDAREWTSADRGLAAEVLERFVQLVATVSPGAKLGSTAPHAYAQALMVEWGASQPRTLANAFLRPVKERPDLLANTYDAVATHLQELDGMYGRRTERRLAAVSATDALSEAVGSQAQPLADVAKWLAQQTAEAR
jgi:CRISPR system Cascade subunit CasC